MQRERIKDVERHLKYTFNDEELMAISRELSNSVAQRSAFEAEKKRVSKDYDARIATHDAVIEANSEKIRSGYEIRATPCFIRFNDPQPGKKSTYRRNDGSLVDVEPMTAFEMQDPLPGFDDDNGGAVIDAEIPTGEANEAPDETDDTDAGTLTVLRALLDEPMKSAAYKDALSSASRRELETALPHAAPARRKRDIERHIKLLSDLNPEVAPPESEDEDEE